MLVMGDNYEGSCLSVTARLKMKHVLDELCIRHGTGGRVQTDV